MGLWGLSPCGGVMGERVVLQPIALMTLGSSCSRLLSLRLSRWCLVCLSKQEPGGREREVLVAGWCLVYCQRRVSSLLSWIVFRATGRLFSCTGKGPYTQANPYPPPPHPPPSPALALVPRSPIAARRCRGPSPWFGHSLSDHKAGARELKSP